MTNISNTVESGQHTQGRIEFRANGDANSYALLDDKGNWWMSLLMNGEQHTVTQLANLRRLAACWNAFDGMPTEAPEELVGIGGVQGLANDIAEAQDEKLYLRAENASICESQNKFLKEHVNPALDQLHAARALLADLNAMDNCDGIARTCTGEACTSYGFQDLMVRVDTFLKGKPVAPQAPAPDQPAASMFKIDDAVALLRDILKADDEARAALVALGMGPDVSTSEAMALTERIRALLKGEPVDKRSDNITVSDVVDAAAHAISLAERAGMVLTVWQEPVKPLAMGNYLTRLDVRPARSVA